jgi:hypothetical protein
VAIAHKILVAAYHMLAEGVPFRELGEAFLDQQARQRTVRHLLSRLDHLGYDVMLRPNRPLTKWPATLSGPTCCGCRQCSSTRCGMLVAEQRICQRAVE